MLAMSRDEKHLDPIDSLESPFLQAVKMGDVASLQSFCADPDFKPEVLDSDGNNAVLIAAESGRLWILKWLLKDKPEGFGFSLDCHNRFGGSVVVLAAKGGNVETFDWLITPKPKGAGLSLEPTYYPHFAQNNNDPVEVWRWAYPEMMALSMGHLSIARLTKRLEYVYFNLVMMRRFKQAAEVAVCYDQFESFNFLAKTAPQRYYEIDAVRAVDTKVNFAAKVAISRDKSHFFVKLVETSRVFLHDEAEVSYCIEEAMKQGSVRILRFLLSKTNKKIENKWIERTIQNGHREVLQIIEELRSGVLDKIKRSSLNKNLIPISFLDEKNFEELDDKKDENPPEALLDSPVGKAVKAVDLKALSSLNVTSENNFYKDCTAAAIYYEQRDVLHWLIIQFPHEQNQLNFHNIQIHPVMQQTIDEGKLKVLRNLILDYPDSRHGSYDRIRDIESYAFLVAIQKEYLHILKWVIFSRYFSGKDILYQMDKDELFSKGSLKIFKFLKNLQWQGSDFSEVLHQEIFVAKNVAHVVENSDARVFKFFMESINFAIHVSFIKEYLNHASFSVLKWLTDPIPVGKGLSIKKAFGIKGALSDETFLNLSHEDGLFIRLRSILSQKEEIFLLALDQFCREDGLERTIKFFSRYRSLEKYEILNKYSKIYKEKITSSGLDEIPEFFDAFIFKKMKELIPQGPCEDFDCVFAEFLKLKDAFALIDEFLNNQQYFYAYQICRQVLNDEKNSSRARECLVQMIEMGQISIDSDEKVTAYQDWNTRSLTPEALIVRATQMVQFLETGEFEKGSWQWDCQKKIDAWMSGCSFFGFPDKESERPIWRGEAVRIFIEYYHQLRKCPRDPKSFALIEQLANQCSINDVLDIDPVSRLSF